MIFLFLSVLLAFLTAVEVARLQHRSWKHQQWETRRSDRTQAALATVERAFALIDKRLDRQRRFLLAIRRGHHEELEVARQEYRAAIVDWNDNFGRIQAELWVAFDRETALRFEGELNDRFVQNGGLLEAALRSGSKANLPDQEELNVLGVKSREFMRQLLRRIQTGDLSGLTGRYELSYENWDNLTIGFLRARLFGLVPPR